MQHGKQTDNIEHVQLVPKHKSRTTQNTYKIEHAPQHKHTNVNTKQDHCNTTRQLENTTSQKPTHAKVRSNKHL